MRIHSRFFVVALVASSFGLSEQTQSLVYRAESPKASSKLPYKADKTVRTWRISFELAFGESSPYAQRFQPGLYDVPYLTSYRITRAVLPEIASKAQTMAGLKQVDFYMGPGGYEKYVSPSGQLLVRGTTGQVRLAIGLIGYLAQQTEVIASTDDPNGDVPVLDVVGFPSTSPKALKQVHSDWLRLNSRSPKLMGFLPLPGRKGGFRIIDSGRSWTARDLASFDYHVDNALKGRRDVRTKRAVVRLLSSKNNWNNQRKGEAYLSDLRAMGRADLAERVKNMNLKIQGTIRRAYGKFARAEKRARA